MSEIGTNEYIEIEDEEAIEKFYALPYPAISISTRSKIIYLNQKAFESLGSPTRVKASKGKINGDYCLILRRTEDPRGYSISNNSRERTMTACRIISAFGLSACDFRFSLRPCVCVKDGIAVKMF